MGYELERYLTYNSFIFGFIINIEDLIVLIKEKTFLGTSVSNLEQIDETYFDLRESFGYNNLNPTEPDIENETFYKIEIGKMISYSLYVLKCMSLLTSEIETKSPARLELEKLSTERDFVNLIAKSKIIDRCTYQQVLTLVKHKGTPLNYLLYCEIEQIQKKIQRPKTRTSY